MSSTLAKATKKSAFSCEPCRRRKVKCGGEQPVCNRCASRKDECIYKLNPTLSYTQRLEDRIKELEDQLAAQTTTKSPISTHPSSSHSSPPSFSSHDVPASNSRLYADERSMHRRFRGLKLDDRGSITYHGATSFFHIPGERAASPAPSTPTSTGGNKFLPLTEANANPRPNLMSTSWQNRSLNNMSEIPEPFQYLLNVHWCWIQPLFNFVHRPAFSRDMQSMGPYYSHTLLNAVMSHSIRWAKSDPSTDSRLNLSYDGGAVFGKHARSMVFDELSRGVVTVPTIQTLLILSAQECAHANTAQAWTYSGLAFRLIDHLGICVDGKRYQSPVPISDEDIEIRHRLFWSCYFWDKMISLYLGRAPSIQHSAVSPPHPIFDESAETAPWVPFGAHPTGTWNYPPAMAHSASCFMSMCQLSVIFNEILIHMYDPLFQNTEQEMNECLRTQELALQQWYSNQPEFLILDPSSLPDVAPPSHIVTLNCLYHTFKILLYRPSLTRTSKPDEDSAPVHNSLVQCVTSATSIIAIFNLFCRTFTTQYCVLSLSYSVYIAATIYLLQVQAFPNDHQALQRLDYCIRCLSEVKKFNPVTAGALNLINRELSRLGITLQSPTYHSAPPETSTAHQDIPDAPFFQNTAGGPGVFQEEPPPMPMDYLFESHGGGVDAFGPDPTAMQPGVFQAMSLLEPLSAWVGTIPEYGPPAPN